jgi:phosphoribosylanthranilate isomerase
VAENTNKPQLKIKVCGMRDAKNIEELSQLAVDYIGYIFYPESRRYVGETPDETIFKIVPKSIKKVGVFVNAPLNEVLRVAETHKLDVVQLHGTEIADYCKAIKEKGIEVIKAFKAEPETLTCETVAYRFSCDYMLFDTPTPMHGGSGERFDWEILRLQKFSLPYFLSGGIGLDDVEKIKNLNLKGLFAVDINSKFETKPGFKDVKLISEFVKQLKS